MTTKILLTSKMMAISLIVYCVCEEKVVNISYSHKHWRDIKQGAHNDRTFLHHVKGSSQSYTMLNGQTFLLLYLGHLIVNFPYSYFYFRPPSPAFHTYPPFLRTYPSKHQPCPLLNNIKASDEYLTSSVHTTHSFLCARHSLQTQCSFEPFAHPLGLNLWSVCHWEKPMTTKQKVPSLTWPQWQHLFVKRPYWTNSTVSTVNMYLKQYFPNGAITHSTINQFSQTLGGQP